ncbi:response regulator [Sphingomonas sp. C3-2]|uniref:response regulator n=1 Tax=Sphingomonas sp. C3-2 TaxID=3062169 RepID=UPI00294AD4DC|nr:response regulator [Sphingomonas sp. C3-2]WOK35571.1 response regulator [Sphingomonas sp. C3-2]
MAQAKMPPGLKILLVEDNDMIASTQAQLLEAMGCVVMHRTSAESALAWLVDGGEAHIVVTDIIMPGMNGVELASHVRTHYPDIAVLLTSGYGEALLEEQQRHFPMIAKPFRSEDLSRAIGNALDGSTLQAAD